MYPQRKSIQKSIALLVLPSLFGAPNIAQEIFSPERHKEISLDSSESLFSELKVSNNDKAFRNKYQNTK